MGSARSVEIRQARARTHGKARRILAEAMHNDYKQNAPVISRLHAGAVCKLWLLRFICGCKLLPLQVQIRSILLQACTAR